MDIEITIRIPMSGPALVTAARILYRIVTRTNGIAQSVAEALPEARRFSRSKPPLNLLTPRRSHARERCGSTAIRRWIRQCHSVAGGGPERQVRVD
jgi:hypothetical protein